MDSEGVIMENLEIQEKEAKSFNFVTEGWSSIKNKDYLNQRYIVEKIIPEGEVVGMIYGESTVGKSFVSLDLALSIATGLSHWQELEIYERRKVVYLTKEGRLGVDKRIAGWLKYHRINDERLEGYFYKHNPKTDDNGRVLDMENEIEYRGFFLSKSTAKQMYDEIKEELGRDNVGLVIFDTFANFFDGNINDQSDTKDFFDGCSLISQYFNCCVLVVHHTAKNNKTAEKGNTNIRATLDFSISCEYEGEEGAYSRKRKLRFAKMKDEEDSTVWGYKLHVEDLGINAQTKKSVTTVVIERDKTVEELREVQLDGATKKGKENAKEIFIGIKNGYINPKRVLIDNKQFPPVYDYYFSRKQLEDFIVEYNSDVSKKSSSLSNNTNPNKDNTMAQRLVEHNILYFVDGKKKDTQFFILNKCPLNGGVWLIPNHWKKDETEENYIKYKGAIHKTEESTGYIDPNVIDVKKYENPMPYSSIEITEECEEECDEEEEEEEELLL